MDRQLNTAVVKLICLEVMFLSHQSFLGFVFRHQVNAIFLPHSHYKCRAMFDTESYSKLHFTAEVLFYVDMYM